MLLDPVNSITSIEFYKKVAKQDLGRSTAYLAYIALLFTLTATIALKVKVGPVLDQTFTWLETSMPKLTFFNGRLTADPVEPVTIKHPSVEEVSVRIDTGRTEPVGALEMEKMGVSAFVTGNAMYLMSRPGRVDTHDFGTAAAEPGAKPVVIDGTFYRKAADLVGKVMYPVAMIITFIIFLCWTLASTAFFALVAMIINSATSANLEFKPLINITLYAQTLITLLQAIFLFMKVGIPFAPLVSFATTSVYLYLAIKRNAEPTPAPAA